MPPSTNSSIPVTKLEASLERKTTALPISRGGAQTAERVSLTHPLYLTLDVLLSGRAGQGVPQ